MSIAVKVGFVYFKIEKNDCFVDLNAHSAEAGEGNRMIDHEYVCYVLFELIIEIMTCFDIYTWSTPYKVDPRYSHTPT